MLIEPVTKRLTIDLTIGRARVSVPRHNFSTGKVWVPFLRHYLSVSILFLLLCEGTALIVAYDVAMSLQSEKDIGSFLLQLEPYLYSAIMIASIIALGLYRIHYRHTSLGTLMRILMSFALGTVFLLVLSWMVPTSTLAFDSRVIIAAQIISSVFILITHTLFFGLIDRSTMQTSVLVLGAGQRADSLSNLRRKSDLRTVSIKGFIQCTADETRVSRDKLVNTDPDDIFNYAIENRIDEVLVAPDDRRACFPVKQLHLCKMNGINVIDLCDFFERETGQVKLDMLHPSWLIFSDGFDRNNGKTSAVRILDVSVSIIALLLLFPVFLVTALAMGWDSKQAGSIFYRQKRVGLNDEVFDIIKFRSMVPDAEKEGGAQWAVADDQRITRVGKVIRKYRIDELPQLINVLKGNMSLVGPRPERPEIVKGLRKSIPYYDDRHYVRPGITGWAQINYPYGSCEKDAVEKLQYDLYYTKHKGLLLDLAILLHTVEVIFFKKGSR